MKCYKRVKFHRFSRSIGGRALRFRNSKIARQNRVNFKAVIRSTGIYFIAYHPECRETFFLIPCRWRVDWHYCSKYIKASIGRLVLRGNLSWENITRHYLPTGFTMLFLLTVMAILVNELPRKMIRYQVIIFTQWIKQVKASFPRRSACCWAEENFLCGFDLHCKYLDSGHTRPVL